MLRTVKFFVMRALMLNSARPRSLFTSHGT